MDTTTSITPAAQPPIAASASLKRRLDFDDSHSLSHSEALGLGVGVGVAYTPSAFSAFTLKASKVSDTHSDCPNCENQCEGAEHVAHSTPHKEEGEEEQELEQEEEDVNHPKLNQLKKAALHNAPLPLLPPLSPESSRTADEICSILDLAPIQQSKSRRRTIVPISFHIENDHPLNYQLSRLFESDSRPSSTETVESEISPRESPHASQSPAAAAANPNNIMTDPRRDQFQPARTQTPVNGRSETPVRLTRARSSFGFNEESMVPLIAREDGEEN